METLEKERFSKFFRYLTTVRYVERNQKRSKKRTAEGSEPERKRKKLLVWKPEADNDAIGSQSSASKYPFRFVYSAYVRKK